MLTVKKMVTAVLAVAGTLVFAAPAQAAAADEPCGFWENNLDAYYNHCATSRILIRVDLAGGGAENDYCRLVNGGNTWLGQASLVDHAYYISSGVCPV